ncbi:MAG: protein-L-isoaspartate O-methyltransferase [Woeseiaceae bacterium]
MNTDYAREQMVEQQVRAWEVFDTAILDVFRAVPRERFVPPAYELLAFADTEIPIGHGQSMLTPTIEGRLLQSLELRPTDRVLEVGTGTGFLCACLARLAASVTSIDIVEEFVEGARLRFEDAGTGNVELFVMDAMRELPDGRFDAIAVTGSIQHFDPRFVEALRPDGRLFIVVGDAPVMEARRIRRGPGEDWRTESLFETCLTPLVHGAAPPGFLF